MNSLLFDNLNSNSLLVLTLQSGEIITGVYIERLENFIKLSVEIEDIYFVDISSIALIKVKRNSVEEKTNEVESFDDLDDIDIFGKSISAQEMEVDYKMNTDYENKIIAKLTNHEDIKKIIENEDHYFDRTYAIERYNKLLTEQLLDISDLDYFYDFRERYLGWIQKYQELEMIFQKMEDRFFSEVSILIEKAKTLNDLNEIGVKYKELINAEVFFQKQRSIIRDEIASCKNTIKLDQLRRKLTKIKWTTEIEELYLLRKKEILGNDN